MYLTHGSRAGSVEGFAHHDGRRGARGTEDHREVRGIGDSSESLVGSDPGDIAGKQQPRTCRADAAPHDGRRPGRGQEGAGCQRRFPVITARSMDCSSEPDGLATVAGALPGARRRCEPGKRTHGPGPQACLALLAATTLLALAAPAQAQTEVWTATLTPVDLGFNLLGCSNGVPSGRCSSTTVLSEDSFTYDSTDYTITGFFTRSAGNLEIIVDADLTTNTLADLTLVVGSTSLVLSGSTASGTSKLIFDSPGVSLTAGTDITVKLTAPGTPNTAAMGAPTITGTAQVGQTLTAVTTGITDADGLTSATYTYQWIRVDGTDEEDISGENSSTYTLVDADLGKTIKVRVSFEDDASNSETLTSAATVTVAADTTPPEVESVTVNSTGSTVTLVFDEHLDDDAAGGLHLSAISLTAGGQAVTAPFADFNLQRQTLALTYRYGTIKQGQTVVFSYTDPTAGDDTDTLQDVAGNDVASFTTGMSGVPAVTNNSTNNAATGEPVISGTAQAGQELTADASPIVDTDGLTGVSYSYQWVRVDADGTSNEEDITDATDATYTLVDADAGKRIKVKVSFTDELSGLEMRTSAAYPSSGTVTAANTTAPELTSVTVTSTPRKTTDTYGAREHIEFSMTFDAPVTVTGDPTFAFDLGGPSTATWYAGSGTTTLRFSHAVSGGSSGDRDTDGISWAENAIALNGGTIAGTDKAGGGGPDPRRPVEPGGSQGRRPDDGRHGRHGHRGGDLDADVAGGHLRFRRDDRHHGHRQRGGGGGGRSGVRVLADQPRQCRQQPAGHLRSHAQYRDDDRIHLHGAGGRPGQQRHLDRHPQPNLHAGRERPHPHGLAADRHRPQPSRVRHARRPQGERIPGGADRTAGSHGADPGVGHRHDAHHRVDAPG